MGWGRILRRFLLMIPTFLGITLVTFAIIDLAGGSRDPESYEDAFSNTGGLSDEDRRRVRETLRLDLPSFLNTDVEDQRRFVEMRTTQLAHDVTSFARRVRLETSIAARGRGTAPDRNMATWIGDQIVGMAVDAIITRAHARPEKIEALRIPELTRAMDAELRDRLSIEEERFRELRRQAAELHGYGGMTLIHLPGALRELGSGSGQKVILGLASRLAGREVEDAAALGELVARRREAWQDENVAGLVERWRVQASGGENPAELEHLENALLGPCGGVAAVPLVEMLLESGDHRLRRRGVAWLRKHAGWEGDYLLPEMVGTPTGTSVQEQLERAERSFRRRWERVRLRYTEIGPVARWGVHIFSETRYAHWLESVATFDFGESIRYRRPVSEVLMSHLPTTLALQIAALLLMYLVAVPLGVWSAVTRWRRTDRVLTVILFALYATPTFWIATLAVLHLDHLLPIYGLLEPELRMGLETGQLTWWSFEVLGDAFLHMILPVAVLTYGGLAALSRYARSGMLDVMRSDYIRTARAQGLSEWRIITRHGVRNGLLPLVTILGGLLPALVGGSIIVETIFSIPGMGLLTFEAATRGDVPLAMGIITLVALMTMAGYFLTDVAHGLLDPRFVRDA